jgi:hypothetical protein
MKIRKKPFEWLLKNSESDRILIVVGARQVGKSTLMKQYKEHQESKNQKVYYLTLEDRQYKTLLDKDPDNLFQIIGLLKDERITVIIDEIQYLQDPTHTLKYLYDMYKEKLKIIVTGSSAFYIDKKFTDSLAGRKFIYEMQSLDFGEFLDFKSFNIPKNYSIQTFKKILPLWHEYIIYGGYPAVVLAKNIDDKKQIIKELADSYTKKDILDYDIKSQENYYRIIKLLAFQCGRLLNINSISNQLDISRTTTERYVYIMEKSFHIQTIKPYSNNGKSEITKMPKVYFHDSGLRNFFCNDFSLFENRIDKGELLENFFLKVSRELYPDQDICFWRDDKKNEVDFIVGDTKAFEIKSNKSNSRLESYTAFTKQYKNIFFEIIDRDDMLKIFLNKDR